MNKILRSFIMLLSGSLLILITIVATASAATYLAWGYVIAISSVAGMTIVFLSFRAQAIPLLFAAILAFCGGFLSAMHIRDASFSIGKRVVTGVSLSEAKQFPDALGYRFDDAIVKSNIIGSYDSPSGDGSPSVTYEVSPIVNSSWKRGDEIHAWAICYTLSCDAVWEQPYSAGVVPNPETTSTSCFWKAVENAEKVHSIKSAKGAILIEWIAEPETIVRRAMNRFWWAVKFWMASWVVVWLIGIIILILKPFFIRWKQSKSEFEACNISQNNE